MESFELFAYKHDIIELKSDYFMDKIGYYKINMVISFETYKCLSCIFQSIRFSDNSELFSAIENIISNIKYEDLSFFKEILKELLTFLYNINNVQIMYPLFKSTKDFYTFLIERKYLIKLDPQSNEVKMIREYIIKLDIERNDIYWYEYQNNLINDNEKLINMYELAQLEYDDKDIYDLIEQDDNYIKQDYKKQDYKKQDYIIKKFIL